MDEETRKKFGFRKELASNLDHINNTILPGNWDSWIIITGSVGAGKSTLASEISYYLNPKDHSIDRCVFSGEQLIEAINKAPKNSVIIFDEAVSELTSNNSQSSMAKELVKVSVQCRYKRLVVLLLLPSIEMINRYFINRSLLLLNVYHDKFQSRGHGMLYNRAKMSTMYSMLKSTLKNNPDRVFSRVYPNFNFRFKNCFMFDEKDYEEKKNKARIESNKKNGGLDRNRLYFKKAADIFMSEYGVSQSKLADKLGISRGQMRTLIGTGR